MKLLTMSGGLVGFAGGAGFGLAQGRGWLSVLWLSALAACLLGMLARWLLVPLDHAPKSDGIAQK